VARFVAYTAIRAAAAFFDPRGKLRGGERAVVMCLAVDRDQSRIVLNYIRSYFADVPYLAQMVRRETRDGVELDNGVDIVVATNSYRSVRGRSVICAIFDEVAVWRSENSAAPDVETYHAVMPGLATLPGAMLIGISSPYKKSGLLYDKWREHYGREGRPGDPRAVDGAQSDA
jgi:phage terminase large subunit-like protein